MRKIVSIICILSLGVFISLSNVEEYAENELPGMTTTNILLD